MNVDDVSELEVFEHYNPFTDELPSDLYWQVGFVIQRANLILKGRTLSELKHALKILQRWRTFTIPAALSALDEIYGDTDVISFSDNQLMYFTRDEFDLSQDNPDKFNAAELFATLALGRIGAIVASDHEDNEDVTAIQSVMMEAVEALGFAEALWLDIMRYRKVSQSISARKSIRHGPAKRWLVNEYLTLEQGLNNRSAARILVERLPQELRQTFDTDDIRDRLAIWIADYKKGRLADVNDLPSFDDFDKTRSKSISVPTKRD